MKKILFSITMIMVLFTAAAANAAGYFSLKGGIIDPSEGYGYDTGYNGEAAIGIKVNPYFIIDIGGGYYTTEREILNIQVYDYKYESTETYTLIPITLTLKGNVPVGEGKAEIYGGGGIGYYLAKREYEEKREYTSYKYTSYYPYYKTYTEKKSDSYTSDANALGYHFVIGCDFNVSKNFALGIEGKWFYVEPKFDYEIYDIKFKDVPTPIGGWIINAGLKIRF